MLSCSCDGDDYAWWHYGGCGVKQLDRKRWRKCCSCKSLIRPGEDCMEFTRWRKPNPYSIAERIYVDEEPLPSWFLCDRCAGLYESLDGLGFCNLLGQDLRQVCREYAEMQRDAGVFRGTMVINRR